MALALLAFASVLWFATNREEKIVVWGELPPTDLAEIKRVVRAKLRHDMFPDFSWSSIKALPTATLHHLKIKIRRVDARDLDGRGSNLVYVWIGKPVSDEGSLAGASYVELFKSTNGWSVYTHAPIE